MQRSCSNDFISQIASYYLVKKEASGNLVVLKTCCLLRNFCHNCSKYRQTTETILSPLNITLKIFFVIDLFPSTTDVPEVYQSVFFLLCSSYLNFSYKSDIKYSFHLQCYFWVILGTCGRLLRGKTGVSCSSLEAHVASLRDLMKIVGHRLLCVQKLYWQVFARLISVARTMIWCNGDAVVRCPYAVL